MCSSRAVYKICTVLLYIEIIYFVSQSLTNQWATFVILRDSQTDSNSKLRCQVNKAFDRIYGVRLKLIILICCWWALVHIALFCTLKAISAYFAFGFCPFYSPHKNNCLFCNYCVQHLFELMCLSVCKIKCMYVLIFLKFLQIECIVAKKNTSTLQFLVYCQCTVYVA